MWSTVFVVALAAFIGLNVAAVLVGAESASD
jgi:hypothetical protein